ncbi:MAG: hypothetical protein WDO70_10925 [Alphaproteobacteria bacterium]
MKNDIVTEEMRSILDLFQIGSKIVFDRPRQRDVHPVRKSVEYVVVGQMLGGADRLAISFLSTGKFNRFMHGNRFEPLSEGSGIDTRMTPSDDERHAVYRSLEECREDQPRRTGNILTGQNAVNGDAQSFRMTGQSIVTRRNLFVCDTYYISETSLCLNVPEGGQPVLAPAYELLTPTAAHLFMSADPMRHVNRIVRGEYQFYPGWDRPMGGLSL